MAIPAITNTSRRQPPPHSCVPAGGPACASGQPARREVRSFGSERGFTLIEVMVAAGLFLFCLGGYISCSYLLHRLQLDSDPRVRAQEVHVDVLKADIQLDASLSDGVCAFSGLMKLDGASLRTTTWTAAGVSPVARNASEVWSALVAGYSAGGHVLTLQAPGASESFGTVLCLRADGRIRALWEIVNTNTTVGGVTGLGTTINRWADMGGASLQCVGTYDQFIALADVSRPGGASGTGTSSTRAIAGASNQGGGVVRVAFPSPQSAGDLFAISGGTKPESAVADVTLVDVRSEGQPRL